MLSEAELIGIDPFIGGILHAGIAHLMLEECYFEPSTKGSQALADSPSICRA